MPEFTIHAEARLGTGSDLITRDVLEAGLHALKHLTYPGVLMTRSLVILDENGLDVTPALFKVVMDAAGSADGDLHSISAEEYELSYKLQMLQYQRIRAQIALLPDERKGFGPDLTFDINSDSADFEAGLRNFLDSLTALGDDEEQTPPAAESPGQ